MNFNEYQDNRAIGALLDEYEKSIIELKEVIIDVSTKDLVEINDHKTHNKDCRSIQTILSHVVGAGYTYIIEVRKWLGEEIDYKSKVLLATIPEYIEALDIMFDYSIKLFEDYPKIKLEEHSSSKKIKVRWGQQYDVEQLFEHAIVHILRHRRQIEQFKFKLKKTKVS
jgi:uncharacterized damage-inducible protein DinB